MMLSFFTGAIILVMAASGSGASAVNELSMRPIVITVGLIALILAVAVIITKFGSKPPRDR